MINSQYNQCPSSTFTPPSQQRTGNRITVVQAHLHRGSAFYSPKQQENPNMQKTGSTLWLNQSQSFLSTTTRTFNPLTLNSKNLSKQTFLILLMVYKCLTFLFFLTDTGLFCSFITLSTFHRSGSHIHAIDVGLGGCMVTVNTILQGNTTPHPPIPVLYSTWECWTILI